MPADGADGNHLEARGWDGAVAAANPASLLLIIESRMGEFLRSRLTADDVLQEALLHAWRDRASHRWAGVRTFRNWLLSIIDHRIQDARDHAGALKRGGGVGHVRLGSPAGASTWGAGPDLPVSTTPSRVAWYREQAGTIRAALESLPDEVRTIVRLRLVEQMQIEEIAAQVGIGPSAVRHRFRQGAEMFRYRLMATLGSAAGLRKTPTAGDADSSP